MAQLELPQLLEPLEQSAEPPLELLMVLLLMELPQEHLEPLQEHTELVQVTTLQELLEV